MQAYKKSDADTPDRILAGVILFPVLAPLANHAGNENLVFITPGLGLIVLLVIAAQMVLLANLIIALSK